MVREGLGSGERLGGQGRHVWEEPQLEQRSVKLGRWEGGGWKPSLSGLLASLTNRPKHVAADQPLSKADTVLVPAPGCQAAWIPLGLGPSQPSCPRLTADGDAALLPPHRGV